MDKLVRGLLADKSIFVTAIDARELVACARETHSLSRVCTAALGRALMQTSMMSNSLKSDDARLTTIIAGGGLAGNMVCTGRPGGIVKGYIENPQIELAPTPEGKLDVALAVGWFGELTVIRDVGMKEPYIGKIRIESGEIAEDFARYYRESEQQPSIVYLGVRIDKDTGDVISAGGLIAQPLPECDEENEAKLAMHAQPISMLSKFLETETLDLAMEHIFADMGYEKTDECVARFLCDCSRERMERVLISLGRDELIDMIEKDGGAEITCHFCTKKYAFSEAELKALLKEALE